MIPKSNSFRQLAAAALLMTAGTAQGEEGGAVIPRGHDLLLFGANWCAPCLAELRELPELADAAAPGRLVLVWEDGAPRKLWPSWPANAEIGSVTRSAAFVGEGEVSAGLPYAIMLDGEGKRCAVLKGRLTPQRTERLRARCARGD